MSLTQLSIHCLIWYGRISLWCSSLTESFKQSIRQWVGPAPCSYHLLPDGRVLPSTIALPVSLQSTSYTYTPDSTILTTPLCDEIRSQRFSWIAVEIEEETGRTDISDWIQSLRWKGRIQPSLHGVLLLWSFLNQRALAIRTIHVVKNTGEEEHITVHV